MSNWISVKDGLPELDVPVLGYSIDGFRIVMLYKRWNGEIEWDCVIRDDHFNEEVTYWMPLPDSPVKKEKEENEQLDLG